MINALMLFAGATVFFGGFYLGLHFDLPKGRKENRRTVGGVISNNDYKNFLSYDGTEQN